MKKYVVIKLWSGINSCSVVAQFDRKEDAIAFANLSKISDSRNEFVVFDKNYTTQEEV